MTDILGALKDLAEAARCACDARQHPPLIEALMEADAILQRAAADETLRLIDGPLDAAPDNTSAGLLAELEAIRDEVDAFDPDARLAAWAIFEAQEQVYQRLPRILTALRQSAAPASGASEAGERWEALAGEKGCKHCQGRGWHMVTVDPDLDHHNPTPCSWCLVPRSALSRPSESAKAVELLRQQVPQWIEDIAPAYSEGGPLGRILRAGAMHRLWNRIENALVALDAQGGAGE